MLRKDGKIELLKQVPLFSHCSKKQLAEIATIDYADRSARGHALDS